VTEQPIRIPAQRPEDWSASTRAELDAVVSVGPRKPVHLPAVIAHHPTFLPPYLGWAKAIALQGVLSARDNALLALRTAVRCNSAFEWGVHAASAPVRAGLLDEEIAAIGIGPEAPGWSPAERLLLSAADELHDVHRISDSTWEALAAHYDRAALLEIAFVVGHYTMLSMVANSAGVPPEEDWRPLPS
jgi:4-carboxymuconolactone decarboxylase